MALCPYVGNIITPKFNYLNLNTSIQSVPGGHGIAHSKQKSVYVHVSYSERFPR
jgi:hypothetical protein